MSQLLNDIDEFLETSEWVPDRTSPRHRSWVITINNYSVRNVQNMRGLIDGTTVRNSSLKAKYVVFNRERAPTTNTPHLQGYIQFTTSVRRDYAIRACCVGTNTHAFMQAAAGSKRQNRDYCTKSDTSDPAYQPSWEEHGDIETMQGQRTELIDFARQICEDYETVESALAKSDFRFLSMVCKFKKGYDTLREKVQSTRRPQPIVYWFYGSTGTGKSREAEELFPDAFWYSEYGSGQWWDGYDQHESVILDDIRPESFNYRFLLRLFDRYPMRVGSKGSTQPFTAKNIVVTAPTKPADFYGTYINEDIAQLERRIHTIKEFV